MIDRRDFMKMLMAAGCASALPANAAPANAVATFGGAAFAAAVAELERRSGGQLGVAVLDLGSGARFGQRADQRLPMCSTFKLLLTAAVLQRAERGRRGLNSRLPISSADLVPNSPLSRQQVGNSASIAALCEATMIWSDNTAANLLLPTIGGPGGLTAFARTLGDEVTRLDRIEPALNEALPGDPRDTSSPNAMLGNLQRLLIEPWLQPASKERLLGWLLDNRTGGTRLRAGLPAGWRVGDKTGSGLQGTTNDVAIVWPPQRSPLLIAAYLTQSTLDDDGRNAIHADLARALVAAVG